MNNTVNSTSDARVVNNVMRHEYRVLSDTEKQHMQRLKDAGLAFIVHLHEMGGTLDTDGSVESDALQGSRELDLAQQRVEEAVMWAVKHLTR